MVSPGAAAVPVPSGGTARRLSHTSAWLHQRRAAPAGAESRGYPSGAGGVRQAGAAASSSSGPAGLPGLPASLHAHPQVRHRQPSGRLLHVLTSVVWTVELQQH